MPVKVPQVSHTREGSKCSATSVSDWISFLDNLIRQEIRKKRILRSRALRATKADDGRSFSIGATLCLDFWGIGCLPSRPLLHLSSLAWLTPRFYLLHSAKCQHLPIFLPLLSFLSTHIPVSSIERLRTKAVNGRRLQNFISNFFHYIFNHRFPILNRWELRIATDTRLAGNEVLHWSGDAWFQAFPSPYKSVRVSYCRILKFFGYPYCGLHSAKFTFWFSVIGSK